MADPMKLLGVEPFAPFWSWFKWIEGISICFFVMAGHSNDNVSEGCKLGFEHGVCLSCSASGCMVEPYNRRPGHWSSSPHWSDTCCQCLTVHSEKHNWGPHLGTAGMYTQSLIPPSNYWYLKFSEKSCAQEFFQASLVSKFHLGWGVGWWIAGTETPNCVLSFWGKWCRRAEKPSYCWGPALSFPCLIPVFHKFYNYSRLWSHPSKCSSCKNSKLHGNQYLIKSHILLVHRKLECLPGHGFFHSIDFLLCFGLHSNIFWRLMQSCSYLLRRLPVEAIFYTDCNIHLEHMSKEKSN